MTYLYKFCNDIGNAFTHAGFLSNSLFLLKMDLDLNRSHSFLHDSKSCLILRKEQGLGQA